MVDAVYAPIAFPLKVSSVRFFPSSEHESDSVVSNIPSLSSSKSRISPIPSLSVSAHAFTVLLIA